MKTKNAIVFCLSLVISLVAFIWMSSSQAAAATFTWDGGGDDNNMTTAANWEGDVAPSTGDDLVFPVSANRHSITNDYTTGTSFNSLTVTGEAASSTTYFFSAVAGYDWPIAAGITNEATGSRTVLTFNVAKISLSGAQALSITDSSNDIKFAGGVAFGSNAITLSGEGSFEFNGSITGSGSLTVNTEGSVYLIASSSSYTGAITINDGEVVVLHANSLGSTAGSTTLAGGTLYIVTGGGDMTIAEPLVWADGFKDLMVRTSYQASGDRDVPADVLTLSGPITLSDDFYLNFQISRVKLTGALSGNYVFEPAGSWGVLEVAGSSNSTKTANGTYIPDPDIIEYSSNSPLSIASIYHNDIVTITGTRGNTTIYGGTLKGSGTVGILTMKRGKLAPGLSPGCMNSGDLILNGGEYEAELGGTTACTDYDSTNVTGTVTLNGVSLSVVLYNGYSPAAGTSYIIISNDGTDAIIGTFDGLAEGSVVTIGSHQFIISYVGGDGNDVTLSIPAAATTTTKVGVPNTGSGIVRVNVLMATMVSFVAAAGIVVLAKRMGPMTTSRKARN